MCPLISGSSAPNIAHDIAQDKLRSTSCICLQLSNDGIEQKWETPTQQCAACNLILVLESLQCSSKCLISWLPYVRARLHALGHLLKHAWKRRPSDGQLGCKDLLLAQHHQHISSKHHIGHLSDRNLPKQFATCTMSGTSVVQSILLHLPCADRPDSMHVSRAP